MELLQLLYLALFGIGLYAALTFLRKYADSFMMIAFAIGCVCCANLYTATNYPIKVGGITFAIDSILYTLFLYTVTVKFIHYSKSDSKLFIYSSCVAIVISAFIEFFAKSISFGYKLEYLQSTLAYLASSVATLIGCIVLRLVCSKMLSNNISRFIVLPVGILVSSIINSTIYYGASALIYGGTYFNDFFGILIGSYIGKIYCIAIGMIGYYINGTIWPVNELKIK